MIASDDSTSSELNGHVKKKKYSLGENVGNKMRAASLSKGGTGSANYGAITGASGRGQVPIEESPLCRKLCAETSVPRTEPCMLLSL